MGMVGMVVAVIRMIVMIRVIIMIGMSVIMVGVVVFAAIMSRLVMVGLTWSWIISSLCNVIGASVVVIDPTYVITAAHAIAFLYVAPFLVARASICGYVVGVSVLRFWHF
jgi:hypothetical protein